MTARVLDVLDRGDEDGYAALEAEIEQTGLAASLLETWADCLSWTSIRGKDLTASGPDTPPGWKAAAARLADTALLNDTALTVASASNLVAELESRQLRAVLRCFAEAITTVTGTGGGLERWWLICQLHSTVDAPQDHLAWGGAAGCAVAAVAAGHPELGRTYVNRLILRDHKAFALALALWMKVAVTVIGPQGEFIAIGFDSDGIPQAVVDTSIATDREARVAGLVQRAIDGARHDDMDAWNRAHEKIRRFSGKDRAIMGWILVRTIAHRLRQLQAEQERNSR